MMLHAIFCVFYYFVCGVSEIPVQATAQSFHFAYKSNGQSGLHFFNYTGGELGIRTSDTFVEMELTFLLCCTLHLTVLGSIFFVFMAGYGLAYVPMSCLNEFLNRPQIVRKRSFKPFFMFLERR